MVDMVPALADNSLLSGGKFADTGYVFICDGSKVNMYDGQSFKITVSEEAVLKGWICPNDLFQPKTDLFSTRALI